MEALGDMDGSVVWRRRMDVVVDVRMSVEGEGVLWMERWHWWWLRAKQVALQKCPSFSHFHCSTNTCSATRAE